MRPEPDDPAGRPGPPKGLTPCGEVRVLEEQTPLPAGAPDVLVGTAFASGTLLADGTVYRPIPEETAENDVRGCTGWSYLMKQ